MGERTKKEKKENSTELQKPNVGAKVYNKTKKCDWGKKKNNLKSLIRFHSANKIDKYNRGWKRAGGAKKKSKKNPKEYT